MVGKNRIKLINSLRYKKFRNEHKLFVAERKTVVNQLCELGFTPVLIICKDEKEISFQYNCKIIEADEKTLKKITNLKGVPDIIGIFKTKAPEFNINNIKHKLTIACQDIQNPGNLGTIIRVADWFGIENIICSENSVDCYNPKVVQASSGALANVNIHYLDLNETLTQIRKENIEIVGTFMNGQNLYKAKLKQETVILFGNEGQGISNEIEKLITQKITIPNYNEKNSVESLNISTAASIIISEFRRRI